MNRIQFFTLIVLSSLVTVLLLGQIFLERQTNYEQNRLGLASQAVNQGQAFQTNLKQLAIRILQVSKQTGDPGLQDLLTRNQITYTQNASPDGASSGSSTPASSPASTAPYTH
jgi:hypothetical protein